MSRRLEISKQKLESLFSVQPGLPSIAEKETKKLKDSKMLFLGEGVLKICSKFTRECPCRSVISIKLLSNFIEIHNSMAALLQIYCIFLRSPFYRNTSGGLFLQNIRKKSCFCQHFLIFFKPSLFSVNSF